MANAPKYTKAEAKIPPLTPEQWEKQNLAKGYVEHPGYKAGKRTADKYKEFYDPTVFSPNLNKEGVYQWSNLKDPTYDFSLPENSPVMRYQAPKADVSPEVNPNQKPLVFTPNYTLNPNTGIATMPDGSSVPMDGYKQGGLVKKLRKKYADGGQIDANTVATLGVAANSLGDLGQGFAGYKAEKNAYNAPYDPNVKPEYQLQTKNAKLGQGVGSATGAGLGFAAGVGLTALTAGAAAPLIPVLSGLGSKGGALAGKSIGARKDRENSRDAFNQQQQQYNQNLIDAENNQLFQSSLAKQMASRNYYKDGGKIVGKGTSKSDSIKAKVEEGSHVIPAENAKIAEQIRESVLGKSNKKANLNQKGGTDVRLSNGEHVFSPEEVKEINSYGIDLDDLSPDAEHGEAEMSKGGLTAAKAKIILHDGTIRGKRLTDKQRKFFGAVSNGYKCGGDIKGYADGGEVDDPFKAVREATVKSQREKDIKELRDLVQQYKDLKQKSTSTNPYQKYQYDNKIVDLSNRMQQIVKKHNLSPSDYEAPATQSSLPKRSPLSTSKSMVNAVSSKKQPDVVSNNNLTVDQMRGISPSIDGDAGDAKSMPFVTPKTGDAITGLGQAIITKSAPSAIDDSFTLLKASDAAPKKPITGADVMSGVGTAINFGVPIVQTALGARYLKKAGARPVDSIDPIFDQTLQNARNRASYGFTPEELAAINNENNNLTAAQRAAARNYSGGSGGNAYAMERQALNDSFGRNLGVQARNRDLQIDKQRYADQLGLNRVELSRRLFNDKLNAWNQNQAAGANLLGTGLSNLVAASRYEQEKKAIADQNKIMNSYLGTL